MRKLIKFWMKLRKYIALLHEVCKNLNNCKNESVISISKVSANK